jgi:hypothetical protein
MVKEHPGSTRSAFSLALLRGLDENRLHPAVPRLRDRTFTGASQVLLGQTINVILGRTAMTSPTAGTDFSIGDEPA